MQEPELIAQTPDWLVLSKPAGWLSIPGRSPRVAVVSAFAQTRWGALWTVHRLDLETSGVILFARSAEAHRRANDWFQGHRVKKTYDCLARGAPAAPVLLLKTPVRQLASTTQVQIREKFLSPAAGPAILARALPQSGRRHQIRIHLSDAGYPLLGDVSYGGPRVFGGIEIARTALHAARLELPSGEIFEAPWPRDFQRWVDELRALRLNGKEQGHA